MKGLILRDVHRISMIILVFVILALSQGLAFGAARSDSKNGVYLCTGGFVGGGTFALDSLDQTGDGNTTLGDGTPNQYDLVDLDVAFVLTSVGNLQTVVYDASATFTELAPAFIRPDDYGSSGVWVNSKLVTYDLSDEDQKLVRYAVWYCAENLFDGGAVYLDWVAGNSRPEVFLYTGDTTDSYNDTYPIIGIAEADCTSGNPCVIDIGECILARRDGFSYVNTDIGEDLVTAGGAGFQTITNQAESGDHNERVGFFIGANGSDAGYGFSTITGDYALYRVSTAQIVVP